MFEQRKCSTWQGLFRSLPLKSLLRVNALHPHQPPRIREDLPAYTVQHDARYLAATFL